MKSIVVIGAGPAGLTAGLELMRRGDVKVTILEADTRLGGISKTIDHKGNRMDIGGHRFFSKDDRVMKWWSEILPTQGEPSYDDLELMRKKNYQHGGPDPEKVDEVMLLRNRVSRIYYKDAFFDYPVKMNMNTIKNMGFITTIRAGFSYIYYSIFKLKEDSLENFYINRFGKVLYKMFFESYTKKVWGISPKDISPDWGAQRVKGISIKAVLKDMLNSAFGKKNKSNTETSLIEEFYYPKYGPGQLWECVAKEYEKLGGELITGAKVVSLKSSDDKITSVAYVKGGETIELECDDVFSTMPLKDLVASFDFEVPEEVDRIANGLLYRDFVTIGVLVKKLKLENKTKIKTLGNIVPDCWIYVQDKRVRVGRIQIFNNWSPYMVKDARSNVWLGLEYFCNENEHFFRGREDKCAEAAISELVKMNMIDREDVLDYHKEVVYKAYPAYFGTYKEIDKLIRYLDQFKNLYCIGRNGQHRYNNMDHSMITAMYAVEACLDGADKNRIWQVNTESDYHETKKTKA